ncbi:phosphoadenosine phosphosulfate reductase family protein [Chryseobacterium sp. EO14]|uniref:phosphoadenosine phosphosulfate reductase domain-containing protein n=1 Tax=Chryseobacterium sp. EO14 TaxID=2950551 RepID=UPI00210D0BDC|nr:phosphoadenosine phosphosulfate reductase family protein [Chryseobacterium sp. EO14]MCQ4139208.1 phosphoadenosine phosphosulfate reductase family protein [Chryseobacterium sp. EO14]
MIVITPISGGKDSQAATLWAVEKFGLKSLIGVFCDVKWEADETYLHIDYFTNKLGIKFKVLKSKKYDGMVDLAVKRGRFPSATARFCTEELKIFPMIDFILTLKDHIIVVDGIRADESSKRSKMQPECRYFKYYFEPYQNNSMIVEQFSENPPVTHKQKSKLKKAQERLLLGKEDPKFYTYRKEDVFKWCEKYDDSLIRPVFNKTGDEVIYYSLNRGYEINPRYKRGHKRVGCDPCIFEDIPSLKITVIESPAVVDKVIYAEEKANSSFFPPNKIPKRYHSKRDKKGKTYPTMRDVARYINDKTAIPDMFTDDPVFKCKSHYNICE